MASLCPLLPGRRGSVRGGWFRLFVVFSGFCTAVPVLAQIQLAPHIQDQMVVQRGMRWEVSGTAADHERFDVNFAGQGVEVRPAAEVWVAHFEVPSNFAGPAELVVDGGRLVRKVQVGDVWLCSGQSNMALAVRRVSDGDQIVQLTQGKAIYLFQVPKPMTVREPNAGRWTAVTSPDQISRFSAVCLAFGMALHDRINAPVGLIDASLGGTWIESWISAQSFRQLSSAESARTRYARIRKQREADGRRSITFGIDEPSQLFDLMVRPLGRQAIKGVLWYQGEGNRPNAEQYPEMLSVLMKDWRAHWRNASLPFVVVQLPGFGVPSTGLDARSRWAAIRDAQRVAVAASPPSSGLVVSIDLGDGLLHPGAKLPFGRRAADVAFELVYDRERRGFVPMPTGISFEGSAVRVEFDKGRACVKGTSYLSDMVFVAGIDRRWQSAEVDIGPSSIVVRSAPVSRPVAVRYAWSDHPRVGLRSCGNGIPVTPFRSDDWPLN